MAALNRLGRILGRLDGTLPCLPPRVTLSSLSILLVLRAMDKNLLMLSRVTGEEVSLLLKDQLAKESFTKCISQDLSRTSLQVTTSHLKNTLK